MAFEKIDFLQGEDIKPEEVVAKVREMIDEVAREVFDKHIGMLVDWVRTRIGNLEGDDGKKVNWVGFGLNAYNKSDLGWGLQSVSVAFRHHGAAMRMENEFKDPTIGVIAPGLVGKDAPYQVITVPVNKSQGEIITPDEGLRFDEAGIDNLHGVPAMGKKVLVEGPNHARTVVQVKGGQTEQRVQTESEPNQGVYTCEYINVGVEED